MISPLRGSGSGLIYQGFTSVTILKIVWEITGNNLDVWEIFPDKLYLMTCVFVVCRVWRAGGFKAVGGTLDINLHSNHPPYINIL